MENVPRYVPAEKRAAYQALTERHDALAAQIAAMTSQVLKNPPVDLAKAREHLGEVRRLQDELERTTEEMAQLLPAR